jgi:hypothetical protein
MKYPVGTIVLIKEPTHNHWIGQTNIKTFNVYGIVYDAYEKNGFNVYVILFRSEEDLYDMRYMREDTMHLPAHLCVQHLDEDRISLAKNCCKST